MGGVGCKAIALVRGAAALDEDADRFGKFVISEFVSEHVAARGACQKADGHAGGQQGRRQDRRGQFLQRMFHSAESPFPYVVLGSSALSLQ